MSSDGDENASGLPTDAERPITHRHSGMTRRYGRWLWRTLEESNGAAPWVLLGAAGLAAVIGAVLAVAIDSALDLGQQPDVDGAGWGLGFFLGYSGLAMFTHWTLQRREQTRPGRPRKAQCRHCGAPIGLRWGLWGHLAEGQGPYPCPEPEPDINMATILADQGVGRRGPDGLTFRELVASWFESTGEEPGWRHPMFFFPFFWISSVWIPGSVTVLALPRFQLWQRGVAGVAALIGVLILVGMVRWYRR